MFRIQNVRALGTRLVADRSIGKGTLIHTIQPTNILESATYQSVQVETNRHIIDDGMIIYLNHSCWPSTSIDTAVGAVNAARDIEAGEELSFFYPTTEWIMDRPFVCLCGAQQCVRVVAGARFLPVDTLARYRLSGHILKSIRDSLTHRPSTPSEHQNIYLSDMRPETGGLGASG